MYSLRCLLPAAAGLVLLLDATVHAFTPSLSSTAKTTTMAPAKDAQPLVVSMSATEESQGTINIEFPFDDRAVRFAYDEWRIAFNKGDFDPIRFEYFTQNYKALVVQNLKERQKAINEGREPPIFRSLSEFGDWSQDEMNEGYRAGPALNSGSGDVPRPTEVVNQLDETAIMSAYEEWRVAFNKGDFDMTRYEQFKTNYIAMTKENLRARRAAIDAGLQPPTFKSLNEYGDWSLQEFQQARQLQQQEQLQLERDQALAVAQGTQSVSDFGTQPVTVNNVAVPSLTSEKEEAKLIKQYWDIYTTWCAIYNKKPLQSRLPIFINNYWTVSNYCDENPDAKFNLNEYADLTKSELYELSYQRGEKLSLNVVCSDSKLQFSDGTKMQALLDPDSGSKIGSIIETTNGNTYLCENKADGVAVLIGWKQNADDGSITGYVFNKNGTFSNDFMFFCFRRCLKLAVYLYFGINWEGCHFSLSLLLILVPYSKQTKSSLTRDGLVLSLYRKIFSCICLLLCIGFKDGTKVTTSPIPIVASSDTIVKTQGGSMYRLLD